MTILTKMTIEELILLCLLYRHKGGINPTFEDVKFDLSLILPGISPYDIIEMLEEKSFVTKEDSDYIISPRGKSAIMMRTNFVLEMLVNDLKRKPGYLVKLRDLINEQLNASNSKTSEGQVRREESVPVDSDTITIISKEG